MKPQFIYLLNHKKQVRAIADLLEWRHKCFFFNLKLSVNILSFFSALEISVSRVPIVCPAVEEGMW